METVDVVARWMGYTNEKHSVSLSHEHNEISAYTIEDVVPRVE